MILLSNVFNNSYLIKWMMIAHWKIVILDEGWVRKTSFPPKYFKIISSKNKKVQLILLLLKKERYKGIDIKLLFWDRAAQERFHSLPAMYYTNLVWGFISL